jgi:hypothetical protein
LFCFCYIFFLSFHRPPPPRREGYAPHLPPPPLREGNTPQPPRRGSRRATLYSKSLSIKGNGGGVYPSLSGGGGAYPSLSGGATRRLPGVVISFTNYSYCFCFCYIFFLSFH